MTAALAPDPRVPQREALLDEPAIGRLLGAPAVRTFAKYRVGENLRAAYRVGGLPVAARTFPARGSQAAYERALAAAVDAGGRPPVVHAPELGAVFWTFPNDRKLSLLPLLRDRSPELAELLGHRGVTTRIVAYAPERSVTAGCLDAAGRVLAYVKLGAREELRGLAAAASGGARVPRVLARDGDVAILEPLPGRRLDRLGAAELPAALRRLGAALAALHATRPLPAERFDRVDLPRLATAAAVVTRARPDAAEAASRLLALLAAREEHGRGPDVFLHGDANLRNALRQRHGIALLDLEHAAAGPAAAELGQLLAGLHGNPAAARALLAGYAAAAPVPDPRALRWHTAAAVLARVALPAVSRVRTDLLPRLAGLLHSAAGLLA